MWAFPGKQLLFMGCELGDDREWSEERGLNWDLLDDPARAGVQKLMRDLNMAYRATPALWEQDTSPDGFQFLLGRFFAAQVKVHGGRNDQRQDH